VIELRIRQIQQIPDGQPAHRVVQAPSGLVDSPAAPELRWQLRGPVRVLGSQYPEYAPMVVAGGSDYLGLRDPL
jgi:hypothetical protein